MAPASYHHVSMELGALFVLFLGDGYFELLLIFFPHLLSFCKSQLQNCRFSQNYLRTLFSGLLGYKGIITI